MRGGVGVGVGFGVRVGLRVRLRLRVHAPRRLRELGRGRPRLISPISPQCLPISPPHLTGASSARGGRAFVLAARWEAAGPPGVACVAPRLGLGLGSGPGLGSGLGLGLGSGPGLGSGLGLGLGLGLGFAHRRLCRAGAALLVHAISPISRLYLAYTSPISRLYLAYTSPISRLYLACVAPGQHSSCTLDCALSWPLSCGDMGEV